MANETDNSGQNTNNNNSQQQGPGPTDVGGSGADTNVDPAIARHLDMAIEAQDGKADATTQAKTEGADKIGETGQLEGGKGSSGDGKSQPSADGKKPVDAEISEAAKKLAGAKDLVLPDKTVVKGGAERRFYEQREAARQELGAVKGDLNNTRQQLTQLQEKYSTLENSTKQLHGVDAKTLGLGAKIVADLQSDPVGAIKKLLAEAAAQGYNVQDLGVGIDTAAIKRMIEERLPTTENKEPTEAELVAEATKEAAQFYSDFPDAKPHDALIAALLRDHPELDTRSAYFAIKSGFADKGYDWSLSLEDNLKAASGNAEEGKQQLDPNKKPLPSGGNGGGDFKLNDKAAVDDNMDTGDIVKQAMRESGMNI